MKFILSCWRCKRDEFLRDLERQKYLCAFCAEPIPNDIIQQIRDSTSRDVTSQSV